MDKYFRGRKILLISPSFFGYERRIQKRLEELGAEVRFYDDRPSNSAIAKAAIRVMRWTWVRRIRSHFLKLLDSVEDEFSEVLVIKLECMPPDLLRRLRSRLRKARFIYYTYDGLANNANVLRARDQFDDCLTFDGDDARQLPGFRLRPLFYLNEYREIPEAKAFAGACFVGTAHSDRYRLVNRVRSILAGYGMSTITHLYMPHKGMYWVRRLLSPSYWESKMSDFSFIPLSFDGVREIIARSSVVLDFQHLGQTGLTMRTIEMIGARRKLITTNPRVVDYEFYRSENIRVVDRDEPVIEKGFLETPYASLPEAILDRYSLDGWLAEVFRIRAAGAAS
jgi:hypothetical protein